MKVFFDYTNQCNANCLYCFTNSQQSCSDELGLKEIQKVVDVLINQGIKNISIGGGEPFLKYFCEICDYINGRMKISVTTNGTILTHKIITCLEKYDIKITVSVDTINEKNFGLVRRGISLQRVLENVDVLVKNPSIRKNLSVRAVISKITIGDMKELIDFCVKKKIPKLKINSTNGFGRAKENLNLIPDFSSFLKILNELSEYTEHECNNLMIELPVKKYLGDNNEICTLGNKSIYIDNIGNVYPCAFSEKGLLMGNILSQDPKKVFSRINNFSHKNDVCSRCLINRYSEIL